MAYATKQRTSVLSCHGLCCPFLLRWLKFWLYLTGPLTVLEERVYVIPMLKRLNVFVDPAHIKRLSILAKRKGLKTAQLIRLAISEYLERNEK